nr:MarR family transcriptional regulator [Paenactinomyces guangxiensis]
MIKTYQLTIPQVRVLSVLREEGPQSLVEVSRRLESSTSSLSGIVDRLERMGLVCRERDEKDRRVVRISLSEKCQELIKHFPARQAAHFRKYIEKMDTEEVIDLTEKLNKLTRILEEESNLEQQGE